jgi:phosphopantetheinyl transferase (holo-ACP synthase)
MIGIDLIKTSRMQHFMEKFEHKALSRFLSDEEIELVSNYKTDVLKEYIKKQDANKLKTLEDVF